MKFVTALKKGITTATSALSGVLNTIPLVKRVSDGQGVPLRGEDDGTLHAKVTSNALPAGAATETTLASASEKLPATLGAKAGAASLSVVLATDSAHATATKQDTGNTSLGSIDTKLSSQATAAHQVTAQGSLTSIDGKCTLTPDVSDRAARLLGHVEVDASALPALAATSTKQSDGSQIAQARAQIYDGAAWESLLRAVDAVATSLAGMLPTVPKGVFHTTPTARTNGQFGPTEQDANGNALIGLGTQLAGEDLVNDVLKCETQCSGTRISTATTTVVKSGAGFLHAITFGKRVAGEVVTIYNNTAASGTILAVLTSANPLLTDAPFTLPLSVKFSIGCTIVTAAASDITVSWR